MTTKTSVKAGGIQMQHNQTMASGMRLQTALKAGRITGNHNETVACGLGDRIKSSN